VVGRKATACLALHEDGKAIAVNPGIGDAHVCRLRGWRWLSARFHRGDAKKDTIALLARAPRREITTLQQEPSVPRNGEAEVPKKRLPDRCAAQGQRVDEGLRQIVLDLAVTVGVVRGRTAITVKDVVMQVHGSFFRGL